MQAEIDRIIKSGNWMVRTDDDGVAFEGFKWNEIGEWTTPTYFSERPTCNSGGLFGQTQSASGQNAGRCRAVFCETSDVRIVVDGNKIKTDRARIVLVNDLALARGISFNGDLDLSNCTGLQSLPENLTVGGNLNLYNCTGLQSLPKNLTVGGSLYLPDHLK